ncbi:hypothetical protein NL676_007629 [Syzygium grande]|nr:hypothetical protein NL676_007629 [Syzygium grande]
MINTLTSSCTLLLVGVAEGLALAITIAITCWNKRMLGDKIFAQEPSITVTMASVSIICTDETGGLTLTPHEVERCWIGEEVISEDSKISEEFWDGIGILSLLPENGRTSVDNSILSWAAEKWGLKTDIWKQRHSIIKRPTQNKDIVEAVIGKDGGRYRHCRGPATAILDRCSHFCDIEGNRKTMDGNKKIIFEGHIKQMRSKGFESIALACQQVDDSRHDEGNLTMLGLLGLKRTSRDNTREVIEECREAGIKVLLVSSEEVSMLQNIATEFGVIQPDSDALVITGEGFRTSSDEERMDTAARISVGFLDIAHIIAGDSRLTYAEWGMCLLLGIISWCIDLAGKCTLQMTKKWVINSAVPILSFHSRRKLKALNVLRNRDGKTE